jgi:hypothetical protein
MVDVARYFMEFCMTESCGKCIPCRVGTVHMHNLLDKIYKGEARQRDLDMLEKLCDMVMNTSLCGLGQTAPNPVLSTLRYFRHEYLDLLVDGSKDGRMRNGRCRRACGGLIMKRQSQARIITLKIDGVDVAARENETILQLAQENGIFIPPCATWKACRNMAAAACASSR